MWRVLAAFVVFGSVVASAQTMTIPAGFKKAAGGDAYKRFARKGDTISVQAYRDGFYGELVTIAWQWKSEAPTRSELERFEHELAGRSLADNARVVSSSAQFARDPMEATIFEALGEQRTYHRRLYVVDANNLVHLWWTICTAPSTLLLPCGQAQRTMKLEIADAVALPAAPTAPATPPVLPEPWRIAIPAGYVESDQDNASIRATLMRALTGGDESQSRTFVSGPVSLVLIMLRVPGGDDAPRAAIANMDAGMTDGLATSVEHREPEVSKVRQVLPICGDNIVSRVSFTDYERRTLYAVDERDVIYAFSAVCIGQRFERADCEKALESMRLVVPLQISGSNLGRDPRQLQRTVLAIVAGLAAAVFIAWKRYQRRRGGVVAS